MEPAISFTCGCTKCSVGTNKTGMNLLKLSECVVVMKVYNNGSYNFLQTFSVV